MTHLKIDYVEFQSPVLTESKRFFAEAFAWTFTDYGPDYAAFDNGGMDGGLDGTGTDAPPLVILKTGDLEAAERAVVAAGGQVVREIQPFPGGRRFHFKEPGGNILGVWSET